MTRRWSLVALAILIALLVAVPSILAAARVSASVVLVTGTVIAAVASVLAGLAKDSLAELLSKGRTQTAVINDRCLTIRGRLPAVRQVSDPVRLGVHRARPRDGGDDLPPAYIPRDIDGQLREQLATGGFVLIVGDSTAGKSRTAYEAMTAILPDHTLIAPQDRTALLSVLDVATQLSKCVLWLDDIEQFVGPDGLTRARISRVLDGPNCHHVILATVRSTELARYIDPSGTSAAQAQREAHDTLEQAQHLQLSRTFTPAERHRAAARTWDGRIAEALDRANDFGIAEYLAAARELLDLWHTSLEAGAHRRGAALVAAAVDCRRIGLTTPLPRALIEHIHERYLEARGRIPASTDSLDQAWAWATRARTTTALLTPAGDSHPDCVNVFDYLIDHTERTGGTDHHIPDATIVTCTTYAEPADALRIGIITSRQGRYALAHAAYTQARNAYSQVLGPDHPDTLESRGAFSVALAGAERYVEAETEARAVLDARARTLGPDHPDTIRIRVSLANALTGQARYPEAEREHRAVLDAYVRTLGPDHPQTLRARCNVAVDLSRQGRYAEAETEHHTVLKGRIQLFGPTHPDTIRSRINLASALASQGRHDEAENQDRTILGALEHLRGADHPDILDIRAVFESIRNAARTE